jgi:hypothetical protein
MKQDNADLLRGAAQTLTDLADDTRAGLSNEGLTRRVLRLSAVAHAIQGVIDDENPADTVPAEVADLIFTEVPLTGELVVEDVVMEAESWPVEEPAIIAEVEVPEELPEELVVEDILMEEKLVAKPKKAKKSVIVNTDNP